MTQQTENIATSYRVSQIVRQIMKWIFVWGLLFLTACDLNLTNPAASLDAPFWLKYGKHRILEPDNITISFLQVLSDSRCPIKYRCILPGCAVIRLSLSSKEFRSTSVRVSIPDYATHKDTSSHSPIDTLGYKITLLQLDPYREATEKIRPSNYKALLKISKVR